MLDGIGANKAMCLSKVNVLIACTIAVDILRRNLSTSSKIFIKFVFINHCCTHSVNTVHVVYKRLKIEDTSSLQSYIVRCKNAQFLIIYLFFFYQSQTKTNNLIVWLLIENLNNISMLKHV